MTAAPKAPQVIGIKVTIGHGRDRVVVGWLTTDRRWFCEQHGTKPCPHRAALAAHLREHAP